MNVAASVASLPDKPAVYAMYAGRGSYRYVASVGVADNLKRRITHHLIRRDSSVTTGVAAVSLNPDLVTSVEWWEHKDFRKAAKLEAAELVAFDVLNPVLRSRGRTQKAAQEHLEDEAFLAEMRCLFGGAAAGRLVRPSLGEALERIAALEERLEETQRQLDGILADHGER